MIKVLVELSISTSRKCGLPFLSFLIGIIIILGCGVFVIRTERSTIQGVIGRPTGLL